MELQRYTTETKLTNYYPIPRSILELGMSSTCVLMYGILLDRGTLSQKNAYTDGSGWVYVVYPIEELCRILRLSATAVKDSLRMLERKGLVRRIRPSRKLANQLYLFLPKDAVMDTGTGEKSSPESRISVPGRAGKAAPSNRKEQQNVSNKNVSNTYQHSEEESL